MNLNPELSKEQQVVLFLVLAEKVKTFFSNDYYINAADNVLKKCWEWLETKKISEIQLYKLIDSLEDDDIVSMQEMDTDENDIDIWDCIIYAVSFTCRSAYEFNGKYYFPQPIEIVDFGYYQESKIVYERLTLGSEKMLDKIERDFLDYKNDLEIVLRKTMFEKYLK